MQLRHAESNIVRKNLENILTFVLASCPLVAGFFMFESYNGMTNY